MGKVVSQLIHIHQAAAVRVGSLWDDQGACVAVSDEEIFQRRRFTLKQVLFKPERLSQLLPNLAHPADLPKLQALLPHDLLSTLGGTPFISLQHRATTVLIPCFELARAFYFWAGPKIIDFFFHPAQASHICQPVKAPTRHNKRVARILVRPVAVPNIAPALPRAYDPEQLAILAQLLFSTPFAKSFAHAHTSLVRRWTTHPQAHLWLPLALEKQVTVDATGVSFATGDQRYFWVTKLSPQSNYFCFNRLQYFALYDPRSIRRTTGNTPDIEAPLSAAGVRAGLDLGSNPTFDSGQAGNSLYGTPDVRVSSPYDEPVLYPSVERYAKLVQDMCYEASRFITSGRPTILSARGGGRDLTAAKVNLRFDECRYTYATYFQEVAKAFIARRHEVAYLTLNAPALAEGEIPYCKLLPEFSSPLKPPYRVGIAQITYRNSCFYFFQVFASRSKRSGFIYRTDLAPLTVDQLNDLLLAINRADDDWVEARRRFQDRLSKKFGITVQMRARNHLGLADDVSRCIKEMQKELTI